VVLVVNEVLVVSVACLAKAYFQVPCGAGCPAPAGQISSPTVAIESAKYLPIEFAGLEEIMELVA